MWGLSMIGLKLGWYGCYMGDEIFCAQTCPIQIHNVEKLSERIVQGHQSIKGVAIYVKKVIQGDTDMYRILPYSRPPPE